MSDCQPNKTQSQASLYDQLKALIPLANKAGLYDAADFLQTRVNSIEAKEAKPPRERSSRGTRIDGSSRIGE